MTATSLTGALDTSDVRRAGLLSRYLRRPAGLVSLIVFVLIVAVAVLAPILAPQDPNLVQLAITRTPPSPAHLLGGDSAGRDILSRLIFGARTTLWGGVVTVFTCTVLGTPAGVAAGYFGGLLDRVATWISDALQSVPGMIILLVVAAGTRSNFVLLMATIGVLLAPGYYRIARSTTSAIRNEPYIDAAKVSGLTDLRIIALHVLRPIYPPIIIQTALTAGIALGLQAGLQFLGIGSATTPSWGSMMNEGFQLMLSNPLILLWPAVALGVTIAALAVMGSTLAELVQVRSPETPLRRRGTALPAAEARPLPVTAAPDSDTVLSVEGLTVSYPVAGGVNEVVHGISLRVGAGEVVGIIGESGSGKSQTVFSILDLLPESGRAEARSIRLGDQELGSLSRQRRQKLLGRRIGYIPQEPMSNLDPAYTVGHQLTEPLRFVHGLSRAAARRRAEQLLQRVGITDTARVMASYPHQISGGMAQRVLIAGALSGGPQLLVADEPTTALDVTVQAEVLELLRELQQEFQTALLIVTHNFGVVADLCDRVLVMRDGVVVEAGPVEEVFLRPQHEYTEALIAASLDDAAGRAELDEQWSRSAAMSTQPEWRAS